MAIYRLGDIGEFKGGISSLDKDKYDNGINFINYMDIFKNSYISNLNHLRKYDASKKDYEKYNVLFGDALFTASSETPEEIAISSVYLRKDKAIFNGFSKRYRYNQEILIPKYASYLFRSNSFRSKVKQYATGYTRFNISQTDLKKTEVLIPSIELQKKIIDIIEQNEKLFLSYSNCVRIDNIENTRKDMKNLIDIIEPIELMMKTLLILNSNMNHIILNLPLKTTLQKDIFSNIKTGKLNTNVVTENGKYDFYTCGHKILKSNFNSFKGRYILLSGNGELYSWWADGEFDLYQRVYALTEKKDFFTTLLSVKRDIFRLKRRANGAVIKFIKLSDIKSIKKLDSKYEKNLEIVFKNIKKIELLVKKLKIIKKSLIKILIN